MIPFHVSPLDILAVPTVSSRVITRSDLSPDQVHVYDSVLSWHSDPMAKQYLKLGGYAGTGKTTLVAALARALEQRGEQIAYVAFTGKAVNVMSKKLKASGVLGNCCTLHSLMYRPKSDESGKVIAWEKTEALPYTFIVVDEASMVGKELWDDLCSYGLPILAVGDHGQLPPVGDSVVNLMLTPDLKLERIHRQAEGNPILALAQHVREGRPHVTFRPTDSRVSFISSVSQVAQAIQTDPMNFGAICYTNRTRASLNKYIRQIRGLQGMPQVNDVVICLKNRKPIFNGMRGTIITADSADCDDLDTTPLDIAFADDGLKLRTRVHFPQFGNPKTIDDLNHLKLKYPNRRVTWDTLGMLFDFGYAMTCHKAQGSQFSNVVIMWENLFRDNDTRARWLYTAVTRASEQLYIVKP